MKAYITIEVEVPDTRALPQKTERISEILDKADFEHRVAKVVTVRGDMRDEPLPSRSVH
jgi:hypothetical protein